MFAMNSCSHKCASRQIRYGKAGKSTSISRMGNMNLLPFVSTPFSSPLCICRLEPTTYEKEARHVEHVNEIIQISRASAMAHNH